MTWFETAVAAQRQIMVNQLAEPMAHLAQRCALAWGNARSIDEVLADGVRYIPFSRVVYATDTRGVQVSANVTPAGADLDKRGQDLSTRPFLAFAVPCDGFLLSDVYMSKLDNRSCITAVQAVSGSGGMLGFLAADFSLRDLVKEGPLERPGGDWRQIKGDPAIRGTLFHQVRTASPMDRRIDDVITIMDELICDRGVFHGKLHFSGSRATLWLTDDPFRYRLHVLDEIISPTVCLAYPIRPYASNAATPPELVRPVFEQFKRLRNADEHIYLRSGSLNVISGLVGVTFSCDGSHYMSAQEFLEKDDRFWFGG